jgi:hypothetical protein
MARVPPAIEKNSIAKRLAFRGHNDAIVFPPTSGVRFRPMQLERRKLKRIEMSE